MKGKKMKIYSVKDNKIGFNNTFLAANNAAAMRMFADTCRQKETLFANHPEDFDLYAVGELNENTGEITSEIKFLEHASSFVSE